MQPLKKAIRAVMTDGRKIISMSIVIVSYQRKQNFFV